MNFFRQNIAGNNELFEFEFRKIHRTSGSKYFIKVSRNGMFINNFEMQQRNSKWSIVPPAPGWVTEIQEQLEIAIRNNVNQG